MTGCYDAAREYLAMGLHPIPADGKRPLVDWKGYQSEPPHADQVDEWWRRWPNANVGLVVGRGLIVVDLDGDGAEGLLHNASVALPKDAPRVRTGNGAHVYLSVAEPVGDRIGLLAAPGGKPQVDVRGIGFVVAPPSVHPNGRRYEWEVPLSAEIPPAPAALLRLLRQPKTTEAQAPDRSGYGWVAEALGGVGKGLRDATCTKLAGYFIGKGIDRETVTALLAEGFARNCTPAFGAADVRKCVESIARKHGVTGDGERAITPAHLSAVLDALRSEIASGPRQTVPTPFPSLNDFLGGGFADGELVYLGARPGVGKTALGLEIARAAGKLKRSVLVVSREMVNVALARRLLAQEARVSASAIRSGRLQPGETYGVDTAIPKLARLPIWMTDEAVSLGEITDLVTSWAASPRLDLLIVDYLQLVRAPREIRERRLQVEAVSHTLKTLALQCKLAVLCLSSLARTKDERGKERMPTLSDLRESGELEHDADVVLLLHREPMKPETDCIVAKNRDGRVGRAHLMFRHEFVAFDEATERRDDA